MQRPRTRGGQKPSPEVCPSRYLSYRTVKTPSEQKVSRTHNGQARAPVKVSARSSAPSPNEVFGPLPQPWLRGPNPLPIHGLPWDRWGWTPLPRGKVRKTHRKRSVQDPHRNILTRAFWGLPGTPPS